MNALQVRAFGGYDAISRQWSLEIGRPLRTDWGNTNTMGNPVEDLDFDGLLTETRDFYIAIVLWDDSTERGARWGSPPIRVRFEPPPPREE